MINDRPILHLNLHGCYYDQVENVVKTEEYRKISMFWKRVFIQGHTDTFPFFIKIKGKLYSPDQVIICFSNGYSPNRRQMMFECVGLKIGEGREEWGAIPGEETFVLSLGKRIEHEKRRQVPQDIS